MTINHTNPTAKHGTIAPYCRTLHQSQPGDNILDKATRAELEAAAFRRLLEHLRQRSDVQNIDLMNLAGFCRNCLSKWYRAAAEERGITLSDEAAREIIYGMPYKEWKARYQTEAPASVANPDTPGGR